MSVIIRLQNLPWSANALDIRQFFSGLGIPEGGVHIVGGELGDAFIAFSTDEDARQAFNLNGGKIKEVQVKLMLSSRTEMQKVIEAARNPLAAFMHSAAAAATQPLTALLPAAVPAIVPEVKRDESFGSNKRDKRRSRSRSRDRKDRSRDYDRDRRDRRRRDRSRSRSRDRRRRDRSHSRDRRSKDRDRHSKDRRHSEDKTGSSSNSSLNNTQRENKIGVWEDPVRPAASPVLQQAQALFNTLLPGKIEEARRNITTLATSALITNRNGFQKQTDPFFSNRSNDSWGSPNSFSNQDNGRPEHTSRFDRDYNKGSSSDRSGTRNILGNQAGDDSRMQSSRMGRPEGRPNRFDMNSDKPILSHRPPLLDRPPTMKRTPYDYMKHCCVRLQPFYGGYGEIRRFFQGFFIHNTGIKFINDENGIRTGIVYIRFANPEGKEKAMLKNGLKLKMKHIEIVDLDDETFDKTIDRYQPEHKEPNQFSQNSPYKSRDNTNLFNKKPLNFSSLAVDDLPLFTKEQDMLKIFSDYPLLSILLVTALRHVTAYIKFSNPDDTKKALAEKSKQIFEGKQLSLRPCSDEEFALISKEGSDNGDVIEVEDEEKAFSSDCISLSGLPLKTTDRDITDFFSDVAIVPSKIHLINSPLGFTGQAYCEFSSTEDAEVAIDKDGLPLGSGIVRVSSIPRSDMESIIGSTSRTNINVNPNLNQARPFYPRNFPRGPAPLLGPRGIMGGPRPPMRRFCPPPPALLNTPDMAPPGCTVLMENVPYKAGLDEILEFFDGFEIPADNVLRRYNENGTPSGEAKVIFNSADDAYQAVEDCNHGKIRDRKIFLSQS